MHDHRGLRPCSSRNWRISCGWVDWNGGNAAEIRVAPRKSFRGKTSLSKALRYRGDTCWSFI
ncbi:hypothetical protein RHMOL_Rhmol01G0193800 [Rhododendron molle]|uniref:Uncharacterized protein n=1 Tax=Rhododendron molle TaxID=49168 RepID=A0ACC0Q6L2_RHOML|nr:hypothetical protein RHMOL_Rhmol01G0193800 [Rhododendron molle]